MPTNIFTFVAADVKTTVDAITAGLRWFAAEARAVVSWVDKSIPGAQSALAVLFQAADAAAETLESHAASGFADLVAGAVDEAGGTVANLISASGLDLAGKAILTAADVATITAVKSIAQSAIAVATARLLGQSAPAAPASALPTKPG